MVKPFNRMNVDISCVGNHDLDLGLEHAEKLMKKTNCPWILTNLVDIGNDSKPVANALPRKVLEHQGLKIGFLGFAEPEWIKTMHDDVVDISKMKYLDYNEVLREESAKLKNEEKCDLVFSLNHMRIPDDLIMSETNKAPDVVDIIFGGHDHCYYSDLTSSTGVYIVKSGTDFECFTNFTVLFGVEKDGYE